MRTHIHGGRRRRSPEIPWLLIATAIGIIVVVVAALFFFTGTGGSSTGYATSSDMVVVPATTSVPALNPDLRLRHHRRLRSSLQ